MVKMKSIHTWSNPLDSEHVSRLHATLDLLTLLIHELQNKRNIPERAAYPTGISILERQSISHEWQYKNFKASQWPQL